MPPVVTILPSPAMTSVFGTDDECQVNLVHHIAEVAGWEGF